VAVNARRTIVLEIITALDLDRITPILVKYMKQLTRRQQLQIYKWKGSSHKSPVVWYDDAQDLDKEVGVKLIWFAQEYATRVAGGIWRDQDFQAQGSTAAVAVWLVLQTEDWLAVTEEVHSRDWQSAVMVNVGKGDIELKFSDGCEALLASRGAAAWYRRNLLAFRCRATEVKKRGACRILMQGVAVIPQSEAAEVARSEVDPAEAIESFHNEI
jgi:hypothetical protein